MNETRKTTFAVPKMDCAAEEQLVRAALDGRSGVVGLLVDLQARELTVVHEGAPEEVAAALQPLNLGARVTSTADATEWDLPAAPTAAQEARVLRLALLINAVMF